MPNFINDNNSWNHTVDKAGTINISSKDKYVDRDIKITIPEGSLDLAEGILAGENITFSTENNGVSVNQSDASAIFTPGYIEEVTMEGIRNPEDGEADIELRSDVSGTRIIFSDEDNSGLEVAAKSTLINYTQGILNTIDPIDNPDKSIWWGEPKYLRTINFDSPSQGERFFNIIDCQGTNWLWKTDSEGNVWIEGTD